MTDATDYPFVLIHASGEDPCGGVAFYLSRRPSPGDPRLSSEVQLIDGSVPAWGSTIRCGTCGIEIDPMSADVVLRVP
jgi:hypothetical protein